jgi:CheY-like chemotaxis protein
MRGPVSTSLRILVVDDNTDTALTLGTLLRLSGHEVRVAHDGRDALHAAQEFQPEVILLDIGLPGMDGFEVARQLRASPVFAHTAIVATSGYNREGDRRRAAEVGIDRYVVKPFDPFQLEQNLGAWRRAPRTAVA